MPSKAATAEAKAQSEAGPEAAQASKCLQTALDAGVLSETRQQSSTELKPTSLLLKADGKDIVKKSTARKGRYLLNISAQIAPAAAGRMGSLAQLDTKTPVMYIDFPAGRLKLFGTLCFPRAKYLALRFSPKEVLCEDVFENMVVFSEAWWVGTKAENPEERRLPMPPEVQHAKIHDDADCEWLDAAAAPSGKNSGAAKRARPAADVDGADDCGDADDGDAEQGDLPKGAAGQPALEPALQVWQAPAEQQQRRPARARNSKRLRRSHSSESDSIGSDDAPESDGSAPRRRVSNAARNQGKSVANGFGADHGQPASQRAASLHAALPHRTAVQGSLNGFVQRPAVKPAAKQPPVAADHKREASMGDGGEPSPVVRGRTTPRRASAAAASRRLVVSDTSSDDGGKNAGSEQSDGPDDSGSLSSGSSDGA